MRYTPSGRRDELEHELPHHVPSHEGYLPPRTLSRRSRSPEPIPVHVGEYDEGHGPPGAQSVERDAGGRIRQRPRAPSMSPTRVIIQSKPPSTPPIVIRQPPTVGPTYLPSDTEVISAPHIVPPSEAEPVDLGRPMRAPSRHSERPPTVIPITPGRESPRLEDDYYEDDPGAAQAGYVPVVSEGRPVPPPPLSPRSAIRDQIKRARDEPIVPVVSSHIGDYPPPPAQRIPESVLYEDEHVPSVHRVHRSPSFERVGVHPQTPSGPGDLALHEAIHAHQERLEEQERHLEELGRAAVDAEERREQYFREHEEERDRLFQENEERREREAADLREEVREDVHQVIEERTELHPIAPPETQLGAPPAERPGSPSESEFSRVSGSPSGAESARPVPPPIQTVVAESMPQLQEILDLLRAQQVECLETKAAEAARFDVLRDEIADARAEAKRECEERIRMLEEELARTREELELERGQRRSEELERIERERADVIERDEAVRAQLGDITNIVQEQREELALKRELMDERWAEKQTRREYKQARSDAVHDMLDRIIQEREQDRAERELERAAAAERPSIEHVLDELKRQNDAQIELINNLTDAWHADSARQHQETIEAVRASAQEMVPYNLTGYLDEFSKALAGEIRTLLGEVGRLHEQKRTLQFEIGSLMHMHSQYGPGGQFEPEWRPTMGPLAPPPPPGPADMPPGGLGGPPPPDEPPPPARPAWRTVQQRVPRRRRTGKAEAPPAATLAPPEPMQERQQSWATWQPNPAFAPTPPPPGASPLVVPPQGPTGLFGPRSPRGTMYAG
ncbi:hypothetical protein M0805_004689 [Coniferiporia weirii]|nr:hypothetical protein M0805_004689 [Coniferiporia weirii]